MKIDELIRSKRKTVGLYVDFDGRLVVRAPQRLPWRVIEAFVKEREDWIVEQQEKARLLNRRVRPKRYVEGELFSYLGVEYPLVFVDRQRPVLLLDERFELSRSAQKQYAAVSHRREATRLAPLDAEIAREEEVHRPEQEAN